MALENAIDDAFAEARATRQLASESHVANAHAASEYASARGSLEAAATKSQGLWLSFISVAAYYAVSVGAVTHLDLLLERPITLPILGVELPLVGYFVVAPIVFLSLHVYLLTHLRLLAINAEDFNESAKRFLSTQSHDTTLDTEKKRLTNFYVVKLILGSNADLSGLLGVCIRIGVFTTLVLAPLVILLLTLIQFLPYHDERLSTAHRLIFVADLLIVSVFWGSILRLRRKEDQARWRNRTLGGWFSAWRFFVASAGALAIAFSVFVVFQAATFPGETLYSVDCSDRAAESRNDDYGAARWTILRFPTCWTSYFFEGSVNEVSGRRNSLFSNTLVIPDLNLVTQTDAQLETVDVTYSFRGRHLQGAELPRANLRKVDFSGAYLSGANLSWANLKHAGFRCGAIRSIKSDAEFRFSAEPERAKQCADLTGANLEGVNLSDADLPGAVLTGADLTFATIERANFSNVDFDGAKLFLVSANGAFFAGADLSDLRIYGDFNSATFGPEDGPSDRTQSAFRQNVWRLSSADNDFLQSTDFSGATLEGSFENATFRHSDLSESIALGANFNGARFEMVNLVGAHFQNSSLQGAVVFSLLIDAPLKSFTNVDARGAYLQNLSFSNASLNESSFDGAVIIGGEFDEANLEGASFRGAYVVKSDFRNSQSVEPSEFDHAVLLQTSMRALSVPEYERLVSKEIEGCLSRKRKSAEWTVREIFPQLSTEDQERKVDVFSRDDNEFCSDRANWFAALDPRNAPANASKNVIWDEVERRAAHVQSESNENADDDFERLESKFTDRAAYLLRLACATTANQPSSQHKEKSIHVAVGIIRDNFVLLRNEFRKEIASFLLDGDRCPLAKDLNASSQETLREWARTPARETTYFTELTFAPGFDPTVSDATPPPQSTQGPL